MPNHWFLRQRETINDTGTQLKKVDLIARLCESIKIRDKEYESLKIYVRDWKSRVGQKPTGGSNPSLSAFITFTLQGCQTVLMRKLQCAKNERLRLFYCLTPLQQKMPIFLNFKPKLFSKKGRFWENALDNFRQFLRLKSLYFQPQNRLKKCPEKHRFLPVFSIIF